MVAGTEKHDEHDHHPYPVANTPQEGSVTQSA